MLGKAGRNFAAGMSGGIAYVWDPEERLVDVCNYADVALGPVEDAATLKLLLEQHAQLTRSARAGALLADWPRSFSQFVQVMPHDYRRALADQAMLAAE